MNAFRNKKIMPIVRLCCLLFVSVVAFGQVERVAIDGPMGKLSAIVQKPELKPGKRCPMVMLLHGFTGRKEAPLLVMIADSLQARGVASIRFDFNGHGESEGDFQKMTVPNEIDDALCVYRYVRSLPYAGRISVVGHSQGGVVAGMMAGQLRKSLRSIVLLAPAAVLRDDAIRGSTMGVAYDPLDPPEYVLLHGRHRLGRDYIKTAFSLPIYEISAKYRGYACVIHGTGDRLVPYTYGERYHQIYKHSELYLLDGFDHGFSQDMRKVADMVVDYLLKH